MSESYVQGLVSTGRLTDHLERQFDQKVFVDTESPDRLVIHNVDTIVASETSEYQCIDIFDTPHLGLTLALNGVIQVAQSDETVYHEHLIHPACLMIPRVEAALVLGGGDGCALRELLKYRELKTIEMVEIDRKVVDLCRKHFAEVNRGALDDPRSSIIFEDGESYLRNNPNTSYDLIVADLTEPYSLTGPTKELSEHLFSSSFYDFLRERLTDEGILVIQTGGLAYQDEVDKHHIGILEGLRKSFRNVQTAYVFIHSFDQLWGITLASDQPYDPLAMDPDQMLRQKEVNSLEHYDTSSHLSAFRTPKILKE